MGGPASHILEKCAGRFKTPPWAGAGETGERVGGLLQKQTDKQRQGDLAGRPEEKGTRKSETKKTGGGGPRGVKMSKKTHGAA